jgi:hypothetical protein
VARTEKVIVEWHDTPNKRFETKVIVEDEWNEVEADDDIFFYFPDEDSFENAKNKDNELEFWIVEETDNE